MLQEDEKREFQVQQVSEVLTDSTCLRILSPSCSRARYQLHKTIEALENEL